MFQSILFMCTCVLCWSQLTAVPQHNAPQRYIDGKPVHTIANPSFDRSGTRYMVPVLSTTSSSTNAYGNSYSNGQSNGKYNGASTAIGVDNTTSTLNSIQDRLSAVEADRNKKIDALDNKLTRLDGASIERNENLRTEVLEISRKLNSIEWYSSKYDATLEEIRESVDRLRRAANANVGDSKPDSTTQQQSPTIDDKLHGLAVLLTSTRSAVNRIERHLDKLETNTTENSKANKDMQTFLRNAPTKQFINYVLASQRQPVYSLMQGASGIPNVSSESMKKVPVGCSEVSANISGIYRIKSFEDSPVAFFAYCNMETESKKWTVILNRAGGDISFYRNWVEYKNGFGNIYGEFWIGLERLREITSSQLHELYVHLEDFDGKVVVARYSAFAIASEKEDYALNVLGKYNGTAGDSLTYHAGHKFSSYDVDNDLWPEGNCAQAHTGGWWYNSCDMSNLNGKYLQGDTEGKLRYQGIYWNDFHGPDYSLKAVRMMIRPVI